MQRNVCLFLVWVFLAGLLLHSAFAQEVKVLEIWDTYTEPNRQPVVEAAIEQFLKKYPDWQVKRTARPLEDMKTAVMAALAAGVGPDVVLVNNGEHMMGPMVRAKHIVNLDPYAEKYGWTEKLFSPSLWNRARYTLDGKQFGEGSIWAVSLDAELVGVYYNKDLLAQLGLPLFESVTEFEAVMDKVKGAGYTPLVVGILDDWQFFHLYGALQHAALAQQMGADAAQEYLDDIVIRSKPDRTWKEPGNIEAARRLQEWVRKGYLIDGFSALGGDDALQVFLAGGVAFFLQGSWYSSNVAQADFAAGFLPFPSFEKGGALPPQIGGMATPVGISAYSPHPDLAAEYLNFLVASDRTVQLQLELGVLPARVPAPLEGIPENTLYYDLLVAWNEVNRVNRVGHFLDWTTPTMWDTLGEAGRDLLLLRLTPEEFVEKVEKDYREFVAGRGGE